MSQNHHDTWPGQKRNHGTFLSAGVYILALTLVALVLGCAKPTIKASPCPVGVHAASAPPGAYIDQGALLDYDRLVPTPESRRSVDEGYNRHILENPGLFEQLYHDATHGNQRAAWLVCQLEATARSGGAAIARYLASLRCQTIVNCKIDLDKLPFSQTTASGQRILSELAAGLHAEAERLELQNELVSNTLVLLVGVRLASQIKVSLPPLSSVPTSGTMAVDQAAIASVRVPGATQSFGSMSSFKRALGRAGPGKEWHHIVEQTPGNLSRFGPARLHSTDNVIVLDASTHRAISGFYSSVRDFTRGLTVRQWLNTQSFEAQWTYGVKLLRDFGIVP
ncbi:MAG: hypothetical protein OEY28_03485 [Nitrospira sp.]|nr:hypothetical protein [Nitrospira sp.]